jgi:hypothetical protein
MKDKIITIGWHIVARAVWFLVGVCFMVAVLVSPKRACMTMKKALGEM